MHIPDGYLSPSTCAVLYVGSAPFWYVALARLKRELQTRFVPLISLFAALSFVIMMFNIPLPGGTTGHATGAAVAAIVLGPSSAMIAVSIALVIQAFFFADGGITAIGANCFNIAIAGSLTSYAVYRVVAGTSALGSRRRVIAAGAAGYAAINVSALLTAIEFGLQPLLFHDAAGAPLYAPYPLSIAVPAMMIGHLTFAGLAELALTAGVVAYLQRTDISLLRRTVGNSVEVSPSSPKASLRPLWTGLAILMVLTPLGLLAVGAAWGEWSPEDFHNPESRKQIAAASRRTELPAQVPAGLQRLSTIWTAPLPDYAPPLLKSASFGYIMSAMVGTGLIILTVVVLGWVAERIRR